MTRIDSGAAGSVSVPPPMAYEEVQELFYARRNYFPALDLAAEQIFAEADLVIGNAAAGITERLARRHGIRVTDLPAGEAEVKRRYDPAARVLALSPLLNPGQRAFQLATHLASVELAGQIGQIVTEASLSSDETRVLARIGLASYFAGALVLPYRPFLDASETLGYDIALLQDASASAMRPSRTGSARCNAPEHAACRSSSCGSTGLATSPSDSPPPASTSPGWAAPARSGMSTRPSPIPPKSRPS